MKKIITSLIALILCLLISGLCVAESIDFSKLSNDELLALRERIQLEIDLRGLDNNYAFGQWYDYGLGQYLPNPSAVFGAEKKRQAEIASNSDSRFSENLDKVTKGEFESYVGALRMYGFNDIEKSSAISFNAKNAEGIEVRISLIGEVLFVNADKR